MTAEIEPLPDLAMRYAKASLKTHKGEFPEFEWDEVVRILEFVQNRFSDDEQIILHVYDSVIREFSRGHRCGVCGRTQAQNLAINYDCTHEC